MTIGFDPHAHPRLTVSDHGCWVYDAERDDGYARVSVGRVSVLAHHVFYAAFVGPVPKGSHLHHKCGTRSCVNPTHLEPLSPLSHRHEHYVAPSSCPEGHKYPEHAIVDSDGRLRCRTCTARRKRDAKEAAKLRAVYRCACGWSGVRVSLGRWNCPECGHSVGRGGPCVVRSSTPA